MREIKRFGIFTISRNIVSGKLTVLHSISHLLQTSIEEKLVESYNKMRINK